MKMPLVNVLVKHSGKNELIKISKIKRQIKDKLIVQSLWLIQDEEDNIQKGSSADLLTQYLNVETLAEAEGKSIDTIEESDDSDFLCLKLY